MPGQDTVWHDDSTIQMNLHTPAEKGDATFYNLRRSFVFNFLSDFVWKKEVLEIYIKKPKNKPISRAVKHWELSAEKEWHLNWSAWLYGIFLTPFHYDNQYGNYDVKKC